METKETNQIFKIIKFDEKIEKRVFNALKKFKQPLVRKNDEIKLVLEKFGIKEPVYVIDNINVCLIEALSQEAKQVLINFRDENDNETIYPQIIIDEYKNKKMLLKNDFGGCYNIEYLTKIFNLFNIFKVSLDIEDYRIKIYTTHNYPAIFENKHFRIIVAPLEEV